MARKVHSVGSVPLRQVRAYYTRTTLRVYQAYSNQIADAALGAGTFAPPFKLDRMTWIKPSFLWMMYRSAWGARPGQERILAIDMTRDGFEWALANSYLSEYEPGVYTSPVAWRDRLKMAPVRVQWDPERSLSLSALSERTIQVGLGQHAVRRYVQE